MGRGRALTDNAKMEHRSENKGNVTTGRHYVREPAKNCPVNQILMNIISRNAILMQRMSKFICNPIIARSIGYDYMSCHMHNLFQLSVHILRHN